ncbi:MAG: hypothetical protein MUP64_10450 [Anaerolineae bacterium]|nr:hypothetical protein [Anaerolineae bacterium]
MESTQLLDEKTQQNTKNTIPVDFFKKIPDNYDYNKIIDHPTATWLVDKDLKEIENKNIEFYDTFKSLSIFSNYNIIDIYKENLISLYKYYFNLSKIGKESYNILYKKSYIKIFDLAFELFGEMSDFTIEESDIIDDHIMKLIKEDIIEY